jgi:hypothetical protein
LPDDSRVPQKFGKIARKSLSRIYADFVDTNITLTEKIGHFIPTLFFIYSDNETDSEDPIAFPVNLDFFDPEKINDMLASLVKAYDRNRYNLELIVYAQEAMDENGIPTNTSVMFGARDLGGATVHSLYHKEADRGGNVVLKQSEIGNGALHVWLPQTKEGEKIEGLNVEPIHDAFLQYITERYAMASSLTDLFKKV